MSLMIRPYQILFKTIFGMALTTVLFVLLTSIYGLLRLGTAYLSGQFYLMKLLLLNKDFPLGKTLNSFVVHYQSYQKDGFWPLALFFLISIFFSTYLLFVKKSTKGGANNKKITRGPRLLSAKELNKSIDNIIKQEAREIYKDISRVEKRKFSKKKFEKKLTGIPFVCSNKEAIVKIPEFILERHIALIGSTGVGKSTQIKHMIDHLNQQQEKCIIIDINGELYSEMGKEKDIILSPFDKRSHKWDFSYEKSCGKPINASEFSKYIVPKGGEQNSFWWKGGRTVFTELLEKYPNSKDLWAAVTDPNRNFRNHLSGIVDNIIGKEGSSQDAGILGTLSSDLGFLKSLISLNNYSVKDYFSISKWAQDQSQSNVYLIFADKDFESISPIIRIWLNLAVLGRFDAGKDNNLPKMNIIA